MHRLMKNLKKSFKEKYNEKELQKIATKLRKKIITTSHRAKIPHLGSCLSCIDLLTYLYWCELFINPSDPKLINRDRFVLSKGHGAPAIFQVLAEKNFFPVTDLNNFGKAGSLFHEHPPKPGLVPGIEAATGSLGHGLPMALGMALASRILKLNFRCYAMLSDGECNEGSIWEAAMMAASQKVENLIVIIDFNKWQATGRSKDILALDPLREKWSSFGWHTQEINGHDFSQINDAFIEARKIKSKPKAIIANTIKGKGVSFMEDDNNWHYRVPNNTELENALQELDNIK